MATSSPQSTEAAVRLFAIPGELRSFESFDRGHIHDTFLSTWAQDGVTTRYLHQRLNQNVFQDIPGLMRNIERVTGHLERKLRDTGEQDFRVLKLVPTVDGRSWSTNGSGAWRTYEYIENTISCDTCSSPGDAYEAARAFGRFQSYLQDLPVDEVPETIPNFFSSAFRLRQFEEALAADPMGRVAGVEAEVRFVRERADMVNVIDEHLGKGTFPQRIVHGDTKLNNVLFDRDSHRAVCVVDLDTCMAGWTLYDFGDLARFTAATSAEDERNLELAGMDLDTYRELVRGFLDGAGDALTDTERELMPFAARLVTNTVGLRFLTDHIAGDTYFKISREGHNLDRARVQLRMVERMEALDDAMRVT